MFKEKIKLVKEFWGKFFCNVNLCCFSFQSHLHQLHLQEKLSGRVRNYLNLKLNTYILLFGKEAQGLPTTFSSNS